MYRCKNVKDTNVHVQYIILLLLYLIVDYTLCAIPQYSIFLPSNYLSFGKNTSSIPFMLATYNMRCS